MDLDLRVEDGTIKQVLYHLQEEHQAPLVHQAEQELTEHLAHLEQQEHQDHQEQNQHLKHLEHQEHLIDIIFAC